MREIIDMSETNRREYQDAADREKGDTIMSILNKRECLTNAYLESRFEATFVLFGGIIDAIESINSAIDKLPNREEFDGVKAELQSQVGESLRPSKEELENLKEIVRRGGKGGMYG